jgi:hypothetical protein
MLPIALQSRCMISSSQSSLAVPQREPDRTETLSDLVSLGRQPYFWPGSRSPNYWMNRVRCISTWVFVAASKATSVYSPIFIAAATTALTLGQIKQVRVVWGQGPGVPALCARGRMRDPTATTPTCLALVPNKSERNFPLF